MRGSFSCQLVLEDSHAATNVQVCEMCRAACPQGRQHGVQQAAGGPACATLVVPAQVLLCPPEVEHLIEVLTLATRHRSRLSCGCGLSPKSARTSKRLPAEPRSERFGSISGITVEVEKLLREYPAGTILLVGRASWLETLSKLSLGLARQRAEWVRTQLIAGVREMSTTMRWDPKARDALPNRIRVTVGQARCRNLDRTCVTQDETVQFQAAGSATMQD
jgi:hypothetical protein